MKLLACIIFAALALSTCTAAPSLKAVIPTFSIDDSNAPTPHYELDAIRVLSSAWSLYPENDLKRNRAASQLFNTSYPNKTGWNVANGCASVFIADETKIYINVKAETTNFTEIIKIFN